MLAIENLTVEVADKVVLKDINLKIEVGETHVLFGPNGSGKTSLLMSILGFPQYRLIQGKIYFKGEDITHLSIDERARWGIGMAFQRPPVVRGVRTRDLVTACAAQAAQTQTQTTPAAHAAQAVPSVEVKLTAQAGETSVPSGAIPAHLELLAQKLNLLELLDRDINYGFSGGEIKRSELLQLLAQQQELI